MKTKLMALSALKLATPQNGLFDEERAKCIAAIAALEADIAKHCTCDASVNHWCCREHAPPQEPAAAGWIPIDVSLPPDDGHYLCATWLKMDMTQTIEISTYRSGTGSFPDAVVTHWMPLPAAPGGTA